MKQLLTTLLLVTCLIAQAQTFTPGSVRRPTTAGPRTLNIDANGYPMLYPKTGAGVPLLVDTKANKLTGFQTMSGLRASNTPSTLAPTVINTTDNGGGVFVIDPTDSSTPDNTGTVLVTNNGLRYKRLGAATLPNFGAIANDGIDDRPALVNALKYFNTSGQTMRMGGVYDVSSPISITLTNATGSLADGAGRRLVIRGEGASNTVLRKTGSFTEPVLEIWGSTDDNLTIDGLRILPEASRTQARQGIGLSLRNLANFKIKDVQCTFFDLGMYMPDSGEGSVTDCLFEHNNRGLLATPEIGQLAPNAILFTTTAFNSNLQYGAFILNGSVNTFQSCRFLQNGTPGDANSRALKIQFVSYTGGVSVSVQGCYLEGNRGAAAIEIISGSEGKHRLEGNTFNRIGTDVSTNDILFTPINLVADDAQVNKVTLDNSHVGYTGYTPSASRPAVVYSPGANGYNRWIVSDGSVYKFPIEAPVPGPSWQLLNESFDAKAHAGTSNVFPVSGVIDAGGAASYYLYVAADNGTTITSITGVPVGKTIILQADNTVTIQHNANQLMKTQSNTNIGGGSTIGLFRLNSTTWKQIF